MCAQTFSLLHTFTGGNDGGEPGGLIADRAGNLYGDTFFGGIYGGGTIFRLKNTGSGWVLNPLYEFNLNNGGVGGPAGDLAFGRDGNIYAAVGTQGGYGAIFKLQPPPSACRSSVCYWTGTVLYRFGQYPDGSGPNGNLIFDSAGSIYGTTRDGGANTFGTVFKLTYSGGSWTESVLYSFMGGDDGSQPLDGVVMDSAGNLYGTTRFGGLQNCSDGCGTVFELSPSGGGWTEQVLYRFQGQGQGYEPWVGLTFGPAGNLYGTTYFGGSGGGGTVFELTPSGGSWNYSVAYNIAGNGGGPKGRVAFDSAGNLYDTFNFPPTLFKLTPSNGRWIYTNLHDFSNQDGTYPAGNIAIDSAGDVYGTCGSEGQDLYGTAWEYAP